jgi:hypothetical protein
MDDECQMMLIADFSIENNNKRRKYQGAICICFQSLSRCKDMVLFFKTVLLCPAICLPPGGLNNGDAQIFKRSQLFMIRG